MGEILIVIKKEEVEIQIKELIKERDRLIRSLKDYILLLSCLNNINLYNRENMDNYIVKCFSMEQNGEMKEISFESVSKTMKKIRDQLYNLNKQLNTLK